MKGKRKKEKGKSAEFVTFLTYSFLLLTSSFFLITSSFALTREEIIERFKAPPAIQLEGLVRVYADCPADMRREYQLPVAGYVSDVCRHLYRMELKKPIRFTQPGIAVHLGEVRTNVTNVVTRICQHDDGTRFTRIYLASPGGADMRTLRLATTKAFYLAVKGVEIDDAAAKAALIRSDPLLKVEDECARLADWAERGVYTDGMDDDAYLKLARKVLMPGEITRRELNTFVSRLYLYPQLYSAPFCGKYDMLDFDRAIKLRANDPAIRYAALVKFRQVLIFGAGHGEDMDAAVKAFSDFLLALASPQKTDEELIVMLAEAKGKLSGVKPI